MYLSEKRKHGDPFGCNPLRSMFPYLSSFTVITIALRGDSIAAESLAGKVPP
jgi:hypothetical protein